MEPLELAVLCARCSGCSDYVHEWKSSAGRQLPAVFQQLCSSVFFLHLHATELSQLTSIDTLQIGGAAQVARGTS